MSSRQAGFSYLFLLYLVALLGLAALAGRAVEKTSEQRARERDLLFIGQQFENALASYVQSGGGLSAGPAAYPTSLDDLVEDKRYPMVRRHLRKIFVDPMTGTRDWGLQISGGHIIGVYSKSSAQPVKQDGFEPQQAGFAGAGKYSDWVFTWPPPNIQANIPAK